MVHHSKLITFYRKPAFVGLTFLGGIIFFLLQVFYWQQVYSKNEFVIRKLDSSFKSGLFEYGQFNSNKPFVLYESTAKKILKAIGKGKLPQTLSELQVKTGLDSAVIIASLLHYAKPNTKEIPTIDMNSADSSEWEKLPGIGGKTARRIIKYRNRLGGYISKYQLLEIKYFDSSLVSDGRISFVVDSQKIQKIDINSCEIADLYRHPYIGKSYAQLIWGYRKSHYPLTINSLSAIKAIPSEIIVRMTPYLSFRQTEK